MLPGLLLQAVLSQVAVGGSYVGDGTAGRFIDAGVAPVFVTIATEAAGPPVVMWTASMPAGQAKPLPTTALTAGLVTAVGPLGFQLGTDARTNAAGQVYHWVALSAGPALVTTSYAGDGAATRDVPLGFAADFAVQLPEDTGEVSFLGQALVPTAHFASGGTGNALTALTSTGITVSSSTESNQVATGYHLLALQAGGGLFAAGTFVGDATAPHAIGGVPFAPLWVWVQGLNAANAVVHRPRSIPNGTDLSLSFTVSGPQPNYITALAADGFTLGSDAHVNGAGSYCYFAFGAGGSDGGSGPSDAGADGGAGTDGGPGIDAGADSDGGIDPGVGPYRLGCGCQSPAPLGACGALAALVLGWRRRRAQGV